MVSEFRNEQRIESFCSHWRQHLFVHSVFLTVPLQYLSLIQKPGGRSYYASAVSSSTSTASLRLLVPSNPSTRSMGRGNTTVWFFSVLMQLRVWKGGEIGFFWINIDNLSRGPNSCSTYENLEKYNYRSSVSLAPDSICILGFFCQNRWTHLQWKGKRNLEKLKTNWMIKIEEYKSAQVEKHRVWKSDLKIPKVKRSRTVIDRLSWGCFYMIFNDWWFCA